MDSRDRVLAALAHDERDRVRTDLGGMLSTGIHVMAYSSLKTYLGISGGRSRIYDLHQQLARPEEKSVLALSDSEVECLESYRQLRNPQKEITDYS